MGRKQRIWIPNYFYHIVCRGNRRDPLFREESDFITYFYILKEVHERHPFEMTSYCLMTNHLHLQLRSQNESISKVMSLINKRYADYYNIKYRITGHVFEKRYFDKIIPDKTGILEVSRYIHLNPVEAGMVKKPEDYRWSSYRHYRWNTTTPEPYLLTDTLLNYFSGTPPQKKQSYCQFVSELSR